MTEGLREGLRCTYCMAHVKDVDGVWLLAFSDVTEFNRHCSANPYGWEHVPRINVELVVAELRTVIADLDVPVECVRTRIMRGPWTTPTAVEV